MDECLEPKMPGFDITNLANSWLLPAISNVKSGHFESQFISLGINQRFLSAKIYRIVHPATSRAGAFMIKVFEDFDLSRVGQFKSVLDAAGIRTLLKNQYVSSVLGEIPFVEALPELWVLEDKDFERAQELIQGLLTGHPEDQPDWNCGSCGAEVGAAFTNCWKCEAERPQPIPGSH
jgi:hypothetical protein